MDGIFTVSPEISILNSGTLLAHALKHWPGVVLAPERAVCICSARTGLPLLVRNERGEGRGEGDSTADTPARLQARQPSPPSAGGEGEELTTLRTYRRVLRFIVQRPAGSDSPAPFER